MGALARAIETYIAAKDGNRPHRIGDAFEPDATLRMTVRTEAVAFPAVTHGASEIARILSSDFGRRYENVYTFCIGTPPASEVQALTCDWLVCMSEKDGGALRVGWGTYQWTLSQAGRIADLHIVIEAMTVLPARRAAEVFRWAGALPYPWCAAQALPPARRTDAAPSWLGSEPEAEAMMQTLAARHTA
ncbi:hypothetical protein [Chitinasiproducens palmae]|uniref:SnoaL-like domain-containing protein n=1 Tax=Chitinasiproducens palmae TaxID=1770053 RepID=A0A1H2PKI4_9BURK|nr:hypothetical protein [Chitinasiproducens palmae]SDV46454.1 hypothetical protein SAMN05216551_101350 [Chitinasiproducens palmae]